MPSEHDHEAEVTRLRRTFRVAVIAAALGATIGAGVVITVVGAVFSVIDRPASEAKAEKPKGAPPAQKNSAQAQQASTQPPIAARPRRVEEAPQSAPPEAACKDQTWPYLDGKCLTPADVGAARPANVAGNGSAASPSAPETPTPGGSIAAPAQAPPAGAGLATNAQTNAPTVVTTRPDTTGSAVATQPAVAPQPQVGAATGAAPSDTPADSEKKARKKIVRSRSEQQKLARPDDKGTDRHLANAPSRDSSNQRSRYGGSRASDSEDEATSETRTLVLVPTRSQTDGSGGTTKIPRRPVRSRPEPDSIEVRDGWRRDTSDDGGRGFFGGLFGGERD